MKKQFLICCLCSLCVLLFGCAQQNETKMDLQNMSAAQILGEFIEAGYPIYEQMIITEDSDPLKLLGTKHGYTSKVEWMDRRASGLNNNGGFIEVFKNSSDCRERKNDLYLLYAPISSVRYSFFQEGKVLLTLRCDLTTGQATAYEAALKAMAQGKTPEKYVAETKDLRSERAGYIDSFPEYVYSGAKDASFADRHFELKDVPQNTPENLVAMYFYYDIAGEYDKLYDQCGSETLKISAVSTKKHFAGGNYIQEYKVKQLSTLPFETFANLDAYLLKSIKSSIETNKLIEYTLVQADFKMTRPTGWWQAQAELSDGDHTFYFLCGKTQGDHVWKLYEVYWG